MKKQKWFLLLGVILIVGMMAAYFIYSQIFSNNTSFDEGKKIVFVKEPIPLKQWLELPENKNIFSNKGFLLRTASIKKLETLKSGRYALAKGMNSNQIINMFRSGNQEPVKIRTDNVKTLSALAGKLGQNLQADSISFMHAFLDEENFPSQDFDATTIACIMKPNTYDFFWTLTPKQFMEKMETYYQKFWTTERIEKAKRNNLSPIEAIIMASIVKAETSKTIEAPKISALYLNRLRIGMPLQSDPTAVFGAGISHVQRVTNEITHESAYNTYQNKGLPPGPINFPEEVYIEAVLNPEKHDYIYMCAQPGGTGIHNFSKTFEQHKVYAAQYRRWLDQQGIR